MKTSAPKDKALPDVAMSSSEIEPEKLIWSRFVCKQSIGDSIFDDMGIAVKNLDIRLREPFLVFIEKLKGIDRIICLPFALITKNKFETVRKLEFFRVLKKHENETPQHLFNTRDEWVQAIKERTKTDLNNIDFKLKTDDLLKEIANELLLISEPENIDIAAQELRFQATVSLWSCLETLIKDHLVSAINVNPNLAKRLNEHEKLRKEIGLDRIDFSHMIDVDFKLEESIGKLVFVNHNAVKIGNLKLIFEQIYQDLDFHKKLDSGILFHLQLQRNLIVHHHGVIDSEFKKRTGASLDIGETINITPGKIINAFNSVAAFGLEMMAAIIDNKMPGEG
jgi:hypothetical protein